MLNVSNKLKVICKNCRLFLSTAYEPAPQLKNASHLIGSYPIWLAGKKKKNVQENRRSMRILWTSSNTCIVVFVQKIKQF